MSAQNIIISVNAPNAQQTLNNLKVNLGGVGSAARDVGIAFAVANAAIGAAVGAISGLASTINRATDDAAKFQLQIARIANASQSINFSGARNEVLKLSTELGKPVGDIAAAQYKIVASQVADGAKSFAVLRDAGNLAKVTFTDTATAATALTSALNAFNLGANKSTEVTALLAQVANKTGLSLEQVSGGFGRVGPTAEALGLNIQDVAAAIETLGQKGIKGNDAFNLLNILFAKLANPSKELTTILNSLGFANGQLFIEANGLGGALQKLAGALGNNTEEAAKAIGGIRGLRGFLALAGDGAQLYENNLKNTNNAQQQFNASIKGLSETEGAAYLKALNAIKTSFIELGDAIQVALGKSNLLLKEFAGLTQFSANFIRFISGADLKHGSNVQSFLDDFITSKNKLAEESKTGSDTDSKNFANSVDIAKKSLLNYYSSLTTKSAEATKALTEQLATTSETTKLSIIGSIDAINERLSNLKKIVSDSKSINESIQKFRRTEDVAIGKQDTGDRLKIVSKDITDFERLQTQKRLDLHRDLATAKINYAEDSASKIRIINQTIAQNEKQITAQSSIGTKDSLERVQALGKDQIGLIRQRTQARIEEAKIQQQAYINEQIALGVPAALINTRINVTGLLNQGHREELAQLKKIEEQELKVAEAAEKRAEAAKKEIIQQEIQKKALDILINDVTKLNAVDNTGGLKKSLEVRTKTGDFDSAGSITKGLEDFDAKAKKAIESVRAFGGEAAVEQFKKSFDLTTQRADYEKQLIAAVAQKRIEQENIVLAKQFDNLKKRYETEEAKIKQAEETRIKILTASGGGLTLLQNRLSELKPSGVQFQSRVTDPEKVEQLLAIDKIRKALDEAAVANKRFKEVSSDTTAANLESSYKRLSDAIIAGKDAGLNLDKVLEGTGENARTLRNIAAQLRDELRGALEQKSIKEQSKDVLNTIKGQIETITRGIQEIGGTIESVATGKTLEENTRSTVQNIKDAVGELQNLSTLLDGLSGKAKIDISVSSLGGVAGGFNGGFVKGFATGGLTDPRDTIPAMLAPGEYVVNQEQTKRFFPLLQAINSGRIEPARGFAEGGSVTQVGDIHIAVQGGTADDTVRDIGRKLRRELRRGTITFDT